METRALSLPLPTASLKQSATRVSGIVNFGSRQDTGLAISRPDKTESMRLISALQNAGALNADVKRDALAEELAQGKELPLSRRFLYGVVYQDQVVTDQPEFEKIARALLSQPMSPDLQRKLKTDGVALAIEILPPEPEGDAHGASDAPKGPLEQFKEEVFLPLFQVRSGKKKDDAAEEGQESQVVAWPVLSSLMVNGPDHQPNETFQKVADEIRKLPLYNLSSPDLQQAELAELNQNFDPLRTRLIAFEFAKRHYNAVHVEDTWPMLIGALLGFAGETVIEKLHAEGSPGAGIMRTGLLIGIDIVDNAIAQLTQIIQKIQSNGIDTKNQKMVQKIFGVNSWREAANNRFQPKGPLGPIYSGSLLQAVKGASVGALYAPPVGAALSGDYPVISRMAAGATGTIGTALAVPFSLQANLGAQKEAVRQLIREGRLPQPPAGMDEEKYVHQVAMQDYMSSLGNRAPVQSFALVPFVSASILGLEKLGVPRPWAQKLYMSVSPALENVLTIFHVLWGSKVALPKNMKTIENAILDNAASPAAKDVEARKGQQKTIEDNFSDAYSRGLGGFFGNRALLGTLLAAIAVGSYAHVFLNKKGRNKSAHAETEVPAQTSMRFIPAQPARRHPPNPSVVAPQQPATVPPSPDTRSMIRLPLATSAVPMHSIPVIPQASPLMIPVQRPVSVAPPVSPFSMTLPTVPPLTGELPPPHLLGGLNAGFAPIPFQQGYTVRYR